MFEMREAYYNAADIVTANSIDNLQKLEAYVDRKKLVYVPNPLYSVCDAAKRPQLFARRCADDLDLGTTWSNKKTTNCCSKPSLRYRSASHTGGSP